MAGLSFPFCLPQWDAVYFLIIEVQMFEPNSVGAQETHTGAVYPLKNKILTKMFNNPKSCQVNDLVHDFPRHPV